MSDTVQISAAAAAQVRRVPCGLCWAAPGTPCQREPEADHLARWLSALKLGRVTRDEVAAVITRLVVITKWSVVVLDKLGAIWSDDFDAYASGQLPIEQVRCALCQCAPCRCPQFGTPAYFALLDQRHGRGTR
jgi:hypothetical protein